MERKSSSSVTTVFTALGAIVAIIAVIFGLGYLHALFIAGPGRQIETTSQRVNREVTQQSQQYVETQLRGMRDQINRYEDNAVQIAKLQQNPDNAQLVQQMHTQQAGIVTFVREQAHTLPDDAVPTDIRQFLATH